MAAKSKIKTKLPAFMFPTIIGGVIVGIVVLQIEYGYFVPLSNKNTVQKGLTSLNNPQIKTGDQISIEANGEGSNSFVANGNATVNINQQTLLNSIDTINISKETDSSDTIMKN